MRTIKTQSASGRLETTFQGGPGIGDDTQVWHLAYGAVGTRHSELVVLTKFEPDTEAPKRRLGVPVN